MVWHPRIRCFPLLTVVVNVCRPRPVGWLYRYRRHPEMRMRYNCRRYPRNNGCRCPLFRNLFFLCHCGMRWQGVRCHLTVVSPLSAVGAQLSHLLPTDHFCLSRPLSHWCLLKIPTSWNETLLLTHTRQVVRIFSLFETHACARLAAQSVTASSNVQKSTYPRSSASPSPCPSKFPQCTHGRTRVRDLSLPPRPPIVYTGGRGYPRPLSSCGPPKVFPLAGLRLHVVSFRSNIVHACTWSK